ncbi:MULTISPECIES: hypothetical protein [Aerococcus]|uniref:hypothetical protein n=1 Tax=Aerococcus TaxID=1375 RepID=UPI000DCAE460|nr:MULTISPECIES: hypothetical protein [Aerococcus]KAA9231692.1 hypothetical protein F6I37_08745 [Aerococcus mictus]MDK6290898.1 hypothetical protein [Aerococcus urinae]MDK6374733.1 hypothetical protein [Aerococcus urinae]MDK6420242.1 hypothetical protein [Aerococcus urinae]MDK8074608.1 hypothetical protein [Aerococcus urinae]
MAHYNFTPVINYVGLYDHVNTTPSHRITSILDIDNISSILLEVGLSALQYTKHPEESIDFFLNVSLIYTLGDKDRIILNHLSYNISEKTLIDGNEKTSLLIRLLDNDLIKKYKEEIITLDLKSSYIEVVVFYSSDKIETMEEYIEASSVSNNFLYKTKLPIITGDDYE